MTGHLGLEHAQAAQLEVVEESLALEEVARQLRAALQQPLARAAQLRRESETRLRICTPIISSRHCYFPFKPFPICKCLCPGVINKQGEEASNLTCLLREQPVKTVACTRS